MEKKDLIFTIGFATLLILLLLCFLLFFFITYRNRRNKYIHEIAMMKKNFEAALLQSQVEVQEATFSALSKELHDNLGQLLSSSKMLMGIAQRQLTECPDTLNIAEQTVGKAITELRSLSKSLDKEWLEQFDLIENLTAEINRIRSSKLLDIEFIHEGRLPLSYDKQTILFRIIQEGLQNIIKHAEAGNVHITIKTPEKNLLIDIADNGKGFTETSSNGGLGIKNMKQRTHLLGGSIEWLHPASGSEIIIRIPV